ncbi:MAG TPA: hypothetical protein VFH57_05720 [Gammaproteobacteria bacterium]|nr:hypothetical protein [Gammaproteobacteria bacterium]
MNDYETVAVYRTAPPAYITLGRLRAEGIKARLVDEHIVRAVALGGIKLEVAKRDVAHAKQVLETDYSSELE